MRTGVALGPVVCIPIKVYGTKVDDGQAMVDVEASSLGSAAAGVIADSLT